MTYICIQTKEGSLGGYTMTDAEITERPHLIQSLNSTFRVANIKKDKEREKKQNFTLTRVGFSEKLLHLQCKSFLYS